MIKVEEKEVFNFRNAVRGMRNPLNSWGRSDSDFENPVVFKLGEKDLDLMKRLYKGGSEHRKFMRQIFVSMDITAPLYWWKEFDTYKVGTVSNSCSTMHTIHKKEFTDDDFSHDKLMNITDNPGYSPRGSLSNTINTLNYCRSKYLETKDKNWWWQLIQLLPSSYNQKRTITMNYENAATIIRQRKGHKLDEWDILIKELKQLPYLEKIMED